MQLIKLGDLKTFKGYFEKEDNKLRLELLSSHSGYDDNDYLKVFESNIKFIPADDTIQLLLGDNTTLDWNPLVFAIFY